MTSRPKPRRAHPLGFTILHEDRDIIVIDKPAGLLTMGTEHDKVRTAYFMLTDYVRKGAAKSRARIFIVHRLDRETSGVLVFAKTEEAKRRLQDNWDSTAKQYLAVVHGHPRHKSGVIDTLLAENEAFVVYTTNDPSKGKPCRTAYRVLRETKKLSLLEIDLLTGRKHQIRVHLASIGHPVVGDPKYGAPGDTSRQMALHARMLTILHPHSGKPIAFEAPPPAFLGTLVGEALSPPVEPRAIAPGSG